MRSSLFLSIHLMAEFFSNLEKKILVGGYKDVKKNTGYHNYSDSFGKGNKKNMEQRRNGTCWKNRRHANYNPTYNRGSF